MHISLSRKIPFLLAFLVEKSWVSVITWQKHLYAYQLCLIIGKKYLFKKNFQVESGSKKTFAHSGYSSFELWMPAYVHMLIFIWASIWSYKKCIYYSYVFTACIYILNIASRLCNYSYNYEQQLQLRNFTLDFLKQPLVTVWTLTVHELAWDVRYHDGSMYQFIALLTTHNAKHNIYCLLHTW